MHANPATDASTNLLTALFASETQSFPLPDGATFGDLAERLDKPNFRESGQPTALKIVFSASTKPRTTSVAWPELFTTERSLPRPPTQDRLTARHLELRNASGLRIRGQ